MSEGGVSFNRGVVRPVECLKAGWQLIRDDFWLFFGIAFVGMLLAGLVPFYLLMGPMMCGIYLCLLRHEAGRRVTFEMLFEGFNYFGQSLIATLLMVVPIFLLVGLIYGLFIAALVASGMLMAGQPQGQAPDTTVPLAIMAVYLGSLIVVLVIATFLGMLFLFTFPLIVDRGLPAFAAVGTSARAVMANLGGVFGLVLLSSLLYTVGMLLCFVGAYFVMPIYMAAVVVAYRQVFPAEGSVLVLPPAPEWPEPSALEPRSAPADFRSPSESPVTATPPPPSEPGIQRADEAPGGA
jgi:uncharacterized membrane protein